MEFIEYQCSYRKRSKLISCPAAPVLSSFFFFFFFFFFRKKKKVCERENGNIKGGNEMRAGGAMIIIREWVEHSTVQPAGRTAASASSVSKEMRGSGNSLW